MCVTDMVCSIGLTEHTTKENGAIIRQKVNEHFGMQKETFIKVNSKMTWQMGTGNTLTSTDQNTKENSKKMYKKVTEKKNG